MFAPLTLQLHAPERPRRLMRSPRSRAVAAMFGIPADLQQQPCALPFPPITITLAPGDILFITGPSGAGKTTLLRQMREQILRISPESCGHLPQRCDTARTHDSVIDRVAARASSLDVALASLARAGLAEARLLLQPPRTLSEGQQFRLQLALWYASRTSILLVDEFAAALDRTTAKIVAYQLGRFIRNSITSPRPRAAILATSHEDLAADLHPTQLLRVTPEGLQHSARKSHS